MSKLTIISPKDMVKLRSMLGFIEARQKGSHKTFKHNDGRTTVIPFRKRLIKKDFKGYRNFT